MKNISSLIGIPREAIRTELYGVEIEVEGTNLPRRLNSDLWRVELDGSLKATEAWEYVTPGPLSLEGVKSSLDYLASEYTRHRSVVDDSIRAGVHVHMNVQEWNIKQVVTFVTIYYILEDILMKHCGENREGNLFCLRARDAEFVLFRLLRSLKEQNLKYLKDDMIRYSSLNYCSLFKYGSLEFRGMRGTGDLDAIYEWVEIIDELRTSSLKFDTPVDVVSTMSGDGEIAFLNRILPTKGHLFKFDGIEHSIQEATRRVQMIAFGVNWATIDKQSVNIFKKEGW
jgi:hypothetical protein